MLSEKIDVHKRFWNGEGPSLIFIPPKVQQPFEFNGYTDRFVDPCSMWRFEMERARPVIDWPTDGIPTVRPNLGFIFIPSMIGQKYSVRNRSMPSVSSLLDKKAIQAAAAVDVASSELMKRAVDFYTCHRDTDSVAAYQPDTQGVFDLANLIYGERLFSDIAGKDPWVDELLEICLGLYQRVTSHLKPFLNETPGSMIHGHGSPQGAYFPTAGVRMSENSATLISPVMIERRILPVIEKAAYPFGGAFVHFHGKFKEFLTMLCRSDLVKAIDLGNPELYDFRKILPRFAETGTVLYSRITALSGESWRAYTERIGALIKETGARTIVRPMVFPETRTECEEMLGLFHDLTKP